MVIHKTPNGYVGVYKGRYLAGKTREEIIYKFLITI